MDEAVAFLLLVVAAFFLLMLWFDDRIHKLEQLNAPSHIEEQAR